MCGRYKMGRRYLAGDMLEPAPRAPQSGSAQRSVQGIPVSPCLLLRCCFLVAVKGLRFSISLPSFLVFCLPFALSFFLHAALSFLDPGSVLFIHVLLLHECVLISYVWGFLQHVDLRF